MIVERPAESSMVGRRLGEFVLREPIGRGGFGTVYRADQPLLGREAVVKVLHTRLRASAAGTQRFLREARLASRLDHPYAAHIYAFGAEPDGTLWIAMELVRGTPLDQLLKTGGPLRLERLVPLLERICEVVHTAHEQGIVHRDLKPANVMVLARAGRLLPKLLDLGIAKGLAAGSPEVTESAVRIDTLVDADTVASDLDDEPATVRSERRSPPAAVALDDHLTQEGAIIGSPPYMAPEQWSDAAAADARSDLYALGILAYEALTGRTPFRADTLAAYATAHASQPVPPLGGEFPPDLDRVLARALAKDPAARPASALELAADVRAASGLTLEVAALPQLDPLVRESILVDAPHPIAEAAALVDAARNPHQAHGAAGQLVTTVVRYLALLGLAARSRMPPGRDAGPVAAALRDLYRRPLSDAEWLELARELCRPFAAERDAHPVPELVDVFFADDPAGALLADLVAAPGEPTADALSDRLAVVSRLLARLAPLFEYALAAPVSPELGERWMGVRRAERTAIAIRGRAVEPGRVLLIDRDGCPVLALDPVMQIAPPAPGESPEMFLFDGRGRRGARLVALPRAFEQHDERLWDWFRAQLQTSLDEVEELAPAERAAPYRGLAPFSTDDAALFVGREKLVDAVVNRLRVQPLLAVVGRSGAGKSSFVQAGVIPALPAGWRHVLIRPGSAPLVALLARLRQAGVPDGDQPLGDRLRADAAARGPLLLVVDQLEELFTQCHDPSEQNRFAEALVAAARSAEEPVRVIVTLRDDFLLRAEELPGLRDRLVQGLQLLATPDPADLQRIVVEPARRLGFDFEDESRLPEEMVAEVADQPGALALLSFTMARLWERRDRHFKQLTRRAYESLGGVAGALAQHAEATLSEMSADEQRLVRESFRQLVTAEGTRAALSRRELLQVLGGDARAEAVIERLIAARLLVASEVEEGDRVEIIHETLLDAWPRLVTWRREDAIGARLRDQLRQAARQWDERGRPRGLLWRDEALADYQRWQSRTGAALTGAESAFAAASLAEARRARRVRRGGVALAFIALGAAVAVLAWMNNQTRTERARAVDRLVVHYQDQGRVALLDDHNDRALVYLAEAYRLGARSPALAFLLAQAARPFEARLVSLAGHDGGTWVLSYSPDGARVLTSGEDGHVKVWEAATGRRLLDIAAHEKSAFDSAWSPSTDRIVSGSSDGSVAVWDARTGALIARPEPHAGWVFDVGFSPDGRTAVSASLDGLTRVFDPASGRTLARFEGEPRAAASADYSPDGRLLASNRGAEVAIWDLATGAEVGRLTGHTDLVRRIAFSPDGTRLLTVSWDRTARIWRVADGLLEHRLVGHSDRVDDGQWSRDGTRVVTASVDRTARVWSAASGELVATLTGHRGQVFAATFDPSGELVATASRDGTARLWEVATGGRLATFTGHGNAIHQVSFSPDGKDLASASWDGTAQIWRAERGAVRAVVREDGPLAHGSVSPDGARLAVAGPGRVIVRATADLRPIARRELAAVRIGWSRGGERLLLASEDGKVQVWNPDGDRIECSLEQGMTSAAPAGDAAGRIATASAAGQVVLWSSRCQEVASFPAEVGDPTALAFTRDGARLLVAGSTAAVVRDGRDGRLLARLRARRMWFKDATFSHDGRRIATVHQDGTGRVWDAESGAELAVLEGHTQAALSVRFSPDDALVVSGGYDRTIRIWDAQRAQLLATLDGFGGFVRADAAGEDVIGIGLDGTIKVISARRERRSPAEIALLARCRVGRRLEGEKLVPAASDRCGDIGAAQSAQH